MSNGIPYTPPEICEAFKGDCYSVETSADVWAFAILLYCTLTGNFPWELANVTDSYYVEFLAWQRRKSTKIPSQWTRFWPRSLQMFRKLLEIKPDRRCPISDVTKFIEDEWLIKTTPNGNSSAVDHSVSGSSFTGSTNNHHHVTHESPSTRVSHYAGAIETTRFSKPALHDRRIKDWLLTTWLGQNSKRAFVTIATQLRCRDNRVYLVTSTFFVLVLITAFYCGLVHVTVNPLLVHYANKIVRARWHAKCFFFILLFQMFWWVVV